MESFYFYCKLNFNSVLPSSRAHLKYPDVMGIAAFGFFLSSPDTQSSAISQIAYVDDVWEYYFPQDLLCGVYSVCSLSVQIEGTIDLPVRGIAPMAL